MPFSSPESHPLAVYAASIQQLKRLVSVFHANHDSAAYHYLWHTAITALWIDLVNEPREPQWRFYFDLCVEGLIDLFIPFRLFYGLAQSLLTVALRKEAVTGAECQAIMSRFGECGKHHNLAGDMTLAGRIFVNETQAEAAAVGVDDLAKEFDELMLFDEFIVRPDLSSQIDGMTDLLDGHT